MAQGRSASTGLSVSPGLLLRSGKGGPHHCQVKHLHRLTHRQSLTSRMQTRQTEERNTNPEGNETVVVTKHHCTPQNGSPPGLSSSFCVKTVQTSGESVNIITSEFCLSPALKYLGTMPSELWKVSVPLGLSFKHTELCKTLWFRVMEKWGCRSIA
jgi:hypothetical protein